MLKTVGQQLDDGRWFTPSADQNKGPILAQLQHALPHAGVVLEIASGTGQHTVHFARALPDLIWQPSDADAAFRQSIGAWIEQDKLSNVRMPIELDVLRLPWPITH